jgi:hypothetical protein
MLNRIAANLPLSLPHSRPGSWQHELFAGSAAWLPKLVAFLVAGCILTSVYLWQASTISMMQTKARQLQYEAALLEQENVALMLQVAQWNSPNYIEEKASEQGLRDAPPPIYVQIRPAAEPAVTNAEPAAGGQALWRRLTGWLPGSNRSGDLIADHGLRTACVPRSGIAGFSFPIP